MNYLYRPLVSALLLLALIGCKPSQAASSLDEEEALPVLWDQTLIIPDTVFMAEMTAGEIAAAQRTGARAVIVPIGGLEQNGTHVVTAKHDLVVRRFAEKVARRRGSTLVAQTVSFVPQGNFTPPTGHMRMPGTIGVSEATYEALLKDICQSLLVTGFESVILIGDSGGNQTGMERVAYKMDGVYAVPEFYNRDYLDRTFLARLGIEEIDGPEHTTYRHEAILATLDPDYIRYKERTAEGAVLINGINADDLTMLQENGQAILEYRARLTLKAIDDVITKSKI